MAAMEPQLRRMCKSFPELANYQALIDEQHGSDPTWYKAEKTQAWCDEGIASLKLLTEYLDAWKALDPNFVLPNVVADPAFWAQRAPHPSAVLRVTPDA